MRVPRPGLKGEVLRTGTTCDEAAELLGDSPDDPDLDKIDDAKVDIDGDVATITSGASAIVLTTVDGDWKISRFQD